MNRWQRRRLPPRPEPPPDGYMYDIRPGSQEQLVRIEEVELMCRAVYVFFDNFPPEHRAELRKRYESF